jgi:hypothetical protein
LDEDTFALEVKGQTVTTFFVPEIKRNYRIPLRFLAKAKLHPEKRALVTYKINIQKQHTYSYLML